MSDGSNGPAGDESLSPDTIHELLAGRRRRQLLYCLYLYATPIGLPDVADLILEWDQDGPGNDRGERGNDRLEERLRVYNSLYHSHVPKLAEADVVEYDQAEDVVELAHNARFLRPHLEQMVREEVETDEYPPTADDNPRVVRSDVDTT